MPKRHSVTGLNVRARWRSGYAIVSSIGAKLATAKSFLNIHPLCSKVLAAGAIGATFFLFAPASTESAGANGDTRTIYLYHAHTGESIDATYRVDGHYDPEVLKKLNWFLRDWRLNQETNMDPRLFDAVWEAYRGAGATKRIVVLCGYRSPQTNAMLRRRSRAVAEHSQHILGKAMDTTMPGMSMERVRESAARLEMGGVGYYGDTNFVHIDVGGVRMWPRMSYAQLMRLFPDGKTVHIAADGRTLPGYEQARAELAANGTAVASLPPAQNSGIGSFFAWLFGKGNSGDDEDNAATQPQAPAPQPVETAAAQVPAVPEAAMQADATTGSISEQAPPATAEPEAAQTAEADMPLPPERPAGLAFAADVPLPPERPALALAAASPAEDAAQPAPMAVAEAETAAPELPGIITQGPSDGRPTQQLSRSYGALPQALAYAPVAQMEGLRSAVRGAQAASVPKQTARAAVTIVPARLDGSNFGTLTGSTNMAELASATIFGPTLAGLRSAARAENSALSVHPSAGYLARFENSATALSADHFGGPSVAALSRDSHLVLMDNPAGY